MKTTKSKDGTTLAYDTFGSGPALIYITGATCHRNFFPVVADAKAWGKEFTVYSYDRRGRGNSSDTLPYTPEREVEDVEAMIDAAGGAAFVYGHSSGAVIALEAALKLPGKVKKAILFDAAYAANEAEKKDYAVLIASVMDSIRREKNTEAIKKFLIGIGMPTILVHLLPLMPGWKTIRSLAPTLEYDMILTQDLPPIQRAEKIKIPISILYGEKSPASFHEVSTSLKRAIPGASVKAIPGQDHMVNAKVLLPVFKEFFN